MKKNNSQTPKCLISRRQFLLYGTSAISTATIMINLPGVSQAVELVTYGYPKKFILNLSDLKQDEPFEFNYPDELGNSSCSIFKLGKKAGGGIGKQSDIVAFSNFCTHQGGPLNGTYKKEFKAFGPCPFHLTTFDLTRHGIVISGQAYQSLPQVGLEIEDNKLYAVSIMGLLFGRDKNLTS